MALDEDKKNEIAKALEKADPPGKQGGPGKQELEKKNEAQEVVGEIHKAAIVKAVLEDEVIRNEIVTQAMKTIGYELKALNQENITRTQKATYDANKEACKNYGIDDSVPTWQIKLMKVGSGFWFVIYFIFASFTIAPINVIFTGIQSFIKSQWLVLVLAVLCYLIIVAVIPTLIVLIG